MVTHNLSGTYRTAAQNMGLIITDETNPFRPKRFRVLFGTACSIASVEAGFKMAFMGHASNMSATYLEKSQGLFLKEYLKVEPWVTVYGIDKSQFSEVNQNVDALQQKIDDLSVENVNQGKLIDSLVESSAKSKEELVVLKTVVAPLVDMYDEKLKRMKHALDAHKKELLENQSAEREEARAVFGLDDSWEPPDPKETTAIIKSLEAEIPQMENALKILKGLNQPLKRC